MHNSERIMKKLEAYRRKQITPKFQVPVDEEPEEEQGDFKYRRVSRISQEDEFRGRSPEQQACITKLFKGKIEPVYDEYLKVCRKFNLTSDYEEPYSPGKTASFIIDIEPTEEAEARLKPPRYWISFIFPEPNDDSDPCFEIYALNVDRKGFKEKKLKGKRIVSALDHGDSNTVTLCGGNDFDKLTSELVSETLQIFLEACVEKCT
jgi:hypothetical protein